MKQTNRLKKCKLRQSTYRVKSYNITGSYCVVVWYICKWNEILLLRQKKWVAIFVT